MAQWRLLSANLDFTEWARLHSSRAEDIQELQSQAARLGTHLGICLWLLDLSDHRVQHFLKQAICGGTAGGAVWLDDVEQSVESRCQKRRVLGGPFHHRTR